MYKCLILIVYAQIIHYKYYMENTNRTLSQISELDYQGESKEHNLQKRKILDAYAKTENDKSKKLNKGEIFTRQNIQGLLSLFKINLNKLLLIDDDNLVSNMALFMQNACFNNYEESEILTLQENTINILLEGIVEQKKQITCRPSRNFINIVFSSNTQDGNLKNSQQNTFSNTSKKFKNLNHTAIKNARKSIRVYPKQQQQSSQIQKVRTSQPFIPKALTSCFLSPNSQQQTHNAKKLITRKSSIPHRQIKVSTSSCPIILDQSSIIRDFKQIFDKQYIFEVRAFSSLVNFQQSALNKLETTLDQIQREKLTDFIGKNLAIQSVRLIAKLIQKITIKKFNNREQVSIDHKKLFMLYNGQLLLENGSNFKVYMGDNTVLWPNNKQKYKLKFTALTCAIILEDYHLKQQFEQHYPEILENIRQKVNETNKFRQDFFQAALEKDQQRDQQNSEMQAIFYTHNLPNKPLQDCEAAINKLRAKPISSKATSIKNMSKIETKYRKDKAQSIPLAKTISFDLSVANFGHDYTQRKKNLMSNPKLMKKTLQKGYKSIIDCLAKSRFRVFNSTHKNYQSSQLYYDPQYKQFMSFYPFVKIVESQQKLQQKKKFFKHTAKNKNKEFSKYKNPLRESQIREKKRIFYNEKVRKLKIRNIASKQIPNGHKKIFDADRAEKQIAQNSLMNNIIQYPMEGSLKQTLSKIDLALVKKNGLKQARQSVKQVHRTFHDLEGQQFQEQVRNRMSMVMPKGPTLNQDRLTIQSKLKRTTADRAQNSFHNALIDQTNGVNKIAKNLNTKIEKSRPKTGKISQLAAKQRMSSNLKQNFFLKCERIHTEC